MTSGRFHINGEASGSSSNNNEQHSSSSSSSTNNQLQQQQQQVNGAAAADIRENEKIRTFTFSSRERASSSSLAAREQPADGLEEVEIKIPEVINFRPTYDFPTFPFFQCYVMKWVEKANVGITRIKQASTRPSGFRPILI